MKKKFVIEATIDDPKNVLGPEVFYAMNRLCSYQIRPDEDPQTAQTQSRLIPRGTIRGGPLSDELPVDEVPFAPR